MLTQERLKALFDYDETTGLFTWKKQNGSGKGVEGKKAGYKGSDGYIRLRIDFKYCNAHRLAWLYVHGVTPNGFIDHINGIRSDNRMVNLRDVSHSMNLQNRRVSQKNNKSSGLLGVSFENSLNKFRARISINGKQKHLGLFDTKEEAHQAYLIAKREFHSTCTI